MEFTVKSPLIPLLLKQKIINSNNENVGYITGTELKRHFLGRMSYKLLYTDLEIEVIEQKKDNGNRNWQLYLYKDDKYKEPIGSLVMVSNLGDTLNSFGTQYIYTYKNKKYTMRKPYMHGKQRFEVLDSDNEVVGKHLKMEYLSFERTMFVKDASFDKVFTASLLGIMSVVMYIS